MNIFLIGYRCTGKTTIGKVLAERLDWDFLDTDAELVRAAKQSIKDIVQNSGWDTFRDMEREVIQNICGSNGQVVATGGGAILYNENVSWMKKNGQLIWLKASAETIKKRMIRDQTTDTYRPSLTGKGFVDEVEETLLKREPLYKKAMDFCIDTDHTSIEKMVEAILDNLAKS